MNRTHIIQYLRKSLLAFAGAAFLFSAAPNGYAQTFAVDFSNDQGPLTHAMSGWLYSWWHTREAPEHGNIELNPTSWRVGYWGTWDYEYQPMVDAGIHHIQVLLSDVYRNRGHGNWGGFAHDPTWQSLNFPQTVGKTVELVNKNNWNHIAFDIINEPDAFGGETGGSDWYNNAWVPAFRKIRELRPQAEIVGPGFFSANLNHLRNFLEKAKADNVVPDIIAQHLLDNQSPGVVQEYDQMIRAMMDEFGLAQRPISFNEYINPGNIRFVQRRVETISQGERVNIHSAMHSSWDDSGELPPYNSTGDWPSFDGIMSIPAQAERAPYWVYKFYGDMSGRRVWTSGNPAGWEGLATMDLSEPGKPVARFMLGGSNAGSNVSVNLNNIPDEFGSPVDVLVERVHTTGNEVLMRGPIHHWRQNLAVNNGALSFSLSGLPTWTAVMVTVKRSDLLPQAAKPTFDPHRGAYWKPIEVALATTTSGSIIRYTLDGTEPTSSSPLYTGPIDVPVTKTIRAVAFKEGMTPSEVGNGGFKINKFYYGNKNGLYGEFFNNTALSGHPVLTRLDQQLNQRFGGTRWDASLPVNGFSARWAGRLRPAHTGAHQLHIESDDGARLWIDGNLVIDQWQTQSRTTHTTTLQLEGGRDYDLRLEYFKNSGGDMIAILQWTPPSGQQEVIPARRLFPHTAPSGDDLLIPEGTTWSYLAPSGPGDAPTADWKQPAFDDSSWASGPARIGYGNQEEMTVISTSPYRPKALYFRRTFTVEDPEALAATLRLGLRRDDGAVVYLNGEELFRDNMPEGTINYGTFATASVGSAWRRMPVRYLLSRDKLVAGENTIAVEVHNASAGGSDVGFDLYLYNPTRVTIPYVGPIEDHEAFPGEPMPAVSFTVDDGELWASSLMTSASSSNPALIPNETIETWGWGRSRLVSFTPNAGQTGTAEITVHVDNGLEIGSRTFTVTVVNPPENTAPTISEVPNKSVMPDEMSHETIFFVNDSETEPGLLQVTATSSNQTLLPDSNLYINGTGDWRTISVRPAQGQGGQAQVTITVSDGELTASETFTVTVLESAPPGEGQGLCGVYFNNTTLSGTPVLTRTEALDFDWGTGSPAPGVVNNDHFSARWSGTVEAPFDGVYTFRTITDDGVRLWFNDELVIDRWVDRAATADDTPDVTLTSGEKYSIVMEYYESIGGAVARLQWGTPGSSTFAAIPASRLYCEAVQTPPTISSIANQTILVNTNTGPLPFNVGSDHVSPGDLIVSGSSSNTTLAPNANIVFGGSGTNRTVTVTPAADQTGSAAITLTVSNGEWSASTSFTLTATTDAVPMAYAFEDGTMGGWTVVQDAAPAQAWAVRTQFFDGSPHANDHVFPHNGTHAVFQEYWPNRDNAHATIWLRSPEFRLTGGGHLTAWLIGGEGSASLPTHESQVPANSTTNGYLCLVLRDAATGDFVLSARKPGGNPWPSTWQQVTFSAAQLAGLNQDAVYTLDLIDQREGSWGWVGMDSVTIPGSLPGDPQSITPWLMIERSGENQVRLSWPVDTVEWTLQRSPEAGGEYVDAELPVSVEGDENVAYDTILSDRQFYRLVE